MSEHEVVAQMSFDWMVVTYFFLGGLAAGAYLFSVTANYWKKEFKSLAKTAAIAVPVALSLGMFILLIDLGRPLRAWRLFLHFNPTSALSWGVWFLNIFFVLSLAYAWFLLKGKDEKAKRFAYLGVPFGILVGTYTGILLSQAPGKALWHSPLMPILFLTGGFISGLAIVLLLSTGTQDNSILYRLGRVLAWILSVELGLVLIEVIVLSYGGADSILVLQKILIGDFSFLFWIVEILLGACVPIFILFRSEVSPKARAVAAMMALIGIYAMRYIVVIGGQGIS